ncbi:class I SAM-dependent methyltransferase [Bradyrhizobium sp.]|uniref:class I SAM-dependent methyltransferase n=1 Tax=Bradyrhizobium sp. TaxID=376 RepID=UPI003C5981E1
MSSSLIVTTDDLLAMLDRLLLHKLQDYHQDLWLEYQSQRWDRLYASRNAAIPFFVDWPDESLVSCFESGELRPGRVLELGCGHGRNARYFAGRGCQVDAVDFSKEGVAWAMEKNEPGQDISYLCKSIFDLDLRQPTYDIVYDSGCFHHLPPHRRPGYLGLVKRALKPAGRFALVCFTPDGGSGLDDFEVYRQWKLTDDRGQGLGYTSSHLREVFSPGFEILSLRKMQEAPPDRKLFGKDFLWTVLMKPIP